MSSTVPAWSMTFRFSNKICGKLKRFAFVVIFFLFQHATIFIAATLQISKKRFPSGENFFEITSDFC